MPFITLRGEKNLSDLIEAHYGALSAADAKRAEKMLLEANPQLKNLRELRPGTVIRIPGEIGRKPVRKPNDTAAPVSDLLLSQLDTFAGALRADLAEETTALREDKRRLETAQVRRLMEELSELGPVAAGVREGLTRRETALKQAQAFEKLLPAIKGQLTKLLGA